MCGLKSKENMTHTKARNQKKKEKVKAKGISPGQKKEKQNEHKQDWEINGKDREIFD